MVIGTDLPATGWDDSSSVAMDLPEIETRSQVAIDTDEPEVGGLGGWFITQGQYRFTIAEQIIYALWGSGPIPPEIQGAVTITDITGTSRTANASTIQLTDSPIFVQIP